MNCLNRLNRPIARLLSVICAVVIALSLAGSASAKVRPVFSSGTAQFTGPNDFVGVGTARHLGDYTEAGSVAFTPTANPAILQVAGYSDYTASNGHVLHAIINGELNTLTGVVTATLTYDGGTGRFDDATGTATLNAQLAPDGSITATVVGTVDY